MTPNVKGPLQLLSCPSIGTTAKASSVLNKNNALYGAQNMLENGDVSCWNSDGRQSSNDDKARRIIVVIQFNREVDLSDDYAHLNITFQGGFVGLNCSTHVSSDGGKSYICIDQEELDHYVVDAEESNEAQRFDLHKNREGSNSSMKSVTSLKLIFKDSTDFYGRITIYLLEIWGRELSRSRD